MLAGAVALVVWSHPSTRMLLAAGLWLGWVVYWSIAARQAAPALHSEAAASRAVHTRLLYLSLLLLLVPVPGLRTRFLPAGTAVVAAGLTVEALGILLAVWARRHLGRNWSGAVSVVTDHQLIRSGPYRLVRHPIYSAMFLIYAGIGIVSGELHALLGLLVLGGAYWRKIRQEEQTLLENFGPAYESYRRETRALVPWVL